MKKVTDYFRYKLLFVSLASLLSFFAPHSLSSNIYDISFRKHRIERIMPQSKKYLDSLFIYSFECRVEPEEVAALIQHESNWNPNAISRGGAVGLTQVRPSCHYIEDPFNPYENMRVGIRHLRTLKNKYKRREIFYAAYNAGEGKIDRWLNFGWDGNTETIPIKETRRLVDRINSTLNQIYEFQ